MATKNDRLRERAHRAMRHPTLPAPAGLTAGQKKIWQTVTAAMPHDWFTPDNEELLRAYSIHADRLHQLEAALPALELGSREYERVARLCTGESKQILSFARAMRLCQSARTQPVVATNHTQAHNEVLRFADAWEDADGLLAGAMQ